MSTDNLQKHLTSIRKLSTQLNSVCDELKKTVQTVEHFLNDTCSLGIPTCVQVESLATTSISTFLEYRRVGSKFRVAVVETNEAGEDITVKAWSDCARDLKLETFKKLPDLLAKIATDLQTKIEEAKSTSQAVKPILAGLQEGEDSSDDVPF